MNEKEIISKLDENSNFHLTLKTIQITSDEIIDKIISESSKKIIAIKKIDDAYALLKKAYDEKYDLVLVNEKIKFVLPQLIIITTNNIDIIKPIIPVYYYLKDNKIIQNIKTTCNKKYTKAIKLDSTYHICLLISNYLEQL